jgi:cation diffusion facilitator family transporter
MAACDCSAGIRIGVERRTLLTVLAINAVMFVVELLLGLKVQSTGLIADSLDMLADALVYGISLSAVAGNRARQRRAARISGWLQLALAVQVLGDGVRRAIGGSEPLGGWMMAVGLLALAANSLCLLLLSRHRGGGVHMRASLIFSTNDTLANLGVIVSGLLVKLLGSPIPDLVIGVGIALMVARGGQRILREAEAG